MNHNLCYFKWELLSKSALLPYLFYGWTDHTLRIHLGSAGPHLGLHQLLQAKEYQG